MEEKININEKAEEANEVEVHTPKNTKQQTILYTIISIALFCLIYFGGKGLIGMIDRPYYMVCNSVDLTDELTEMHYEYASVSKEYGLEYENSRLEKDEKGYKLSILFSGIDDVEDFAQKGILFNFGDAVEDIETEFYPYNDNLTLAEYVTAVKYVNNDNPNDEILIFEFNGKIYAEYQNYGGFVPTEIKILFDGCEKVY